MEAVLTNASGRMTLGSSVVRIGSVQDNHVVINDPKVAPYHAEIRPEGPEEHSHTIMDLGSMTGTFVNERRLDNNVPWLLHPNDTIRIGDAIFNYEVTGASPADARELKDAPARRLHRPPDGPVPFMNPANGSPDQVDAIGTAPFSINPSMPQGPYSPFAPPVAGVPASPFISPPPKQSPGFPASSGDVRGLGASQTPILGPQSLLEKENRRKLWLAGGLTALVILLVAFLFGSFHSPNRTLNTFCSALQSGDYQTAYNQFSPGVQGQVTESRFASSFAGQKRITSCTPSSLNVSGNSAQATIITNSNHVSTIWLIQDRSFNWEIDGLSSL